MAWADAGTIKAAAVTAVMAVLASQAVALDARGVILSPCGGVAVVGLMAAEYKQSPVLSMA
ncbi:predicted O-methyltransferase [Serpentinimonas maccroryi]|uniref:Predicted O-methyltransferase n=1 Tax=Serpentinimonas maccroryi TaxID=1458426 RepID=A0A060NP62_9BURK|nr:predicted O-methyltransferase [Serpentinimonas maccroryi]